MKSIILEPLLITSLVLPLCGFAGTKTAIDYSNDLKGTWLDLHDDGTLKKKTESVFEKFIQKINEADASFWAALKEIFPDKDKEWVLKQLEQTQAQIVLDQLKSVHQQNKQLSDYWGQEIQQRNELFQEVEKLKKENEELRSQNKPSTRRR